MIVTGRNPDTLASAAGEVDALSTAAFDATDPSALKQFFDGLSTIDHVMVTAGQPHYGRLLDMDMEQVRNNLDRISFGYSRSPAMLLQR